MKRVLGLDLGTASIGWALVEEHANQKSKIIKLGVRVNPLSSDEQTDFEKGRPLSINADRTLKRGARRNLQRFKQRRNNLIEILIKNHIISKHTPLTEIGNDTTHQTLSLRAKAAQKKIEKEEFARVLLAINKKRGYKSSRKAKNEEEGSLIDGMAIAKELYDNNITPGEFVSQLLGEGKRFIPDFYRSDLQNEFDTIWNFQQQFYPNILTNELKKALQHKNKTQTWAICSTPFNIVGISQSGKANEKRQERYQWRVTGLSTQLNLEQLAIVLQEINNNLNKSSGYLGAISDRSKELYFNKQTVGQNLHKQIQDCPHTRLKNQVFYRQDYLDEFEKIWETQAKFHTELTTKLKEEIRDVIIFYQRKLKSQKHLISNCEFEKHHKAVPKSSPLFQEFKIWQVLNNLEFLNKKTKEISKLDDEDRQLLFNELNTKGKFTSKNVLRFMGYSSTNYAINYKEGIEGNNTNKALYNIYQQIAENEGYGFDWNKKSASEIQDELKTIFPLIGIDASILNFDTEIQGTNFDKQTSYQFWHLLYSAEDDDGKISEEDKMQYGNSNVALKKKLHQKYGFKLAYSNMLANISFQQDYGRLSARAIKKIIPFLKTGTDYAESCALAGYNHSNSLTKEELDKRQLKEKLELLQKNSLRNPVVEKILNQMVNVVNQVIKTYGKPDEIRIELARELKKSAKEREESTKYINKATKENEDVRKLLKNDFDIKNPTRNDVIRYKLYLELERSGFKTLYTGEYIPKEKLFSKEIDIEHIIPKAKLFDNSFSNKTLAYRNINLEKADTTALDFITNKHNDDLDNYLSRIESFYNKGKNGISKGKYKKLLLSEKNLPDGFIERDLRNSQYIAKKAKQMLFEVVRTVNTTTGKITSKLREDWDLINVMQELNLPKYKAIDENLIERVEKKDGSYKIRIKDWTKRNDHRHHAMDALTVAFTTHNHVQYLNNLNASRDSKNSKLYGIRNKITKTYEYKNGKKKRKFIPPMPSFREEAKQHIDSILISFKAKNKVVTRNINKTKLKGNDKYHTKTQLTPRGQLHKETIYGRIQKVIVKQEKINAKFDKEKILQVTKPAYKEALLKRLEEFNNDSKKAFTGKNALSKFPIYLNDSKTEQVPEFVKIQFFEDNYTIRKNINPDQFKDLKSLQKIIDIGVRRVLEKRLIDFDNDAKKAFSNLNKTPIWLNKEKGISIKRVSISGISNAEALHSKKDHLGNEILDTKGKTQAVDFVSTGNNHHVAIYKDSKGKLQEKVVSFYDAVARVNLGLPVIDKDFNIDKGWKFQFTMKQNEMFVFPTVDFDPTGMDLLDEKNTDVISKHLFRVQKISTKDYFFRHHLETTVDNIKELKETAYKRLGILSLKNIIKVRINHLGQIVHIGEY